MAWESYNGHEFIKIVELGVYHHCHQIKQSGRRICIFFSVILIYYTHQDHLTTNTTIFSSIHKTLFFNAISQQQYLSEFFPYGLVVWWYALLKHGLLCRAWLGNIIMGMGL
jgi:hypothetical protein